MPLFGGKRDISLIRTINRELMGKIITQQCSIYKIDVKNTNYDIYGESSTTKYYKGPIIINCIIDRSPPEYNIENDVPIDYKWDIKFIFLRDDLLDKFKDFNINNQYGINTVLEVGDIILYEESYYEIGNIITNQYFMGKNPDYPNKPNPLIGDLENFGTNLSIICESHLIPKNKLGIEYSRI